MALGRFYVNKSRAEIGSLFNTDNRYVYKKTSSNSTTSEEAVTLPHLWTMYGNIGTGTVGLRYEFDGSSYVIGTDYGWPWGSAAIPFKLGVM
jgi:hypothetical protein